MMIAMSNIMLTFSPFLYNDAMAMLRHYRQNRWGQKNHLAGLEMNSSIFMIS
jgi:hypothetical protein